MKMNGLLNVIILQIITFLNHNLNNNNTYVLFLIGRYLIAI